MLDLLLVQQGREKLREIIDRSALSLGIVIVPSYLAENQVVDADIILLPIKNRDQENQKEN